MTLCGQYEPVPRDPGRSSSVVGTPGDEDIEVHVATVTAIRKNSNRYRNPARFGTLIYGNFMPPLCVAQSVSIAWSPDRAVAWTVARSLDRSVDRSGARSLGRSVDRSVATAFAVCVSDNCSDTKVKLPPSNRGI